jgi:hypothetical protein
MQTTPPPSNPSGSNYRETYAYLCGLLPPLVGVSPDHQAAYQKDAMDQVVALCPMDAFEARLAARIVAMGAHADDSLRSASRAANDPMEQRRCRAQTVSMARQSDAALRSLHRIQALREKQLAQTHPAAMERAGYWFHDVSAPAPEPAPAPPAAPDPCLATGLDPVVTEAELYAVMYPERAARIRAAGGLPAKLDFGPPEPELVQAIVHGSSPILLALDHQRHNATSESADVAAHETMSHKMAL